MGGFKINIIAGDDIYFEACVESQNVAGDILTFNERNITPIFTKMKHDEIMERIRQNENYLNSDNNSWRIFGLILNEQISESNVELMPNTMKLLFNIPNIINAGISCLEPHVKTLRHKDFNESFFRCHIPLYIPDQ